ncbi:tRNA lysidine(34) synthetase TilS [Sulfitobacter sp.]|uniref:tRNA lysidine(34) synthetase TilS n=1 Tax=Sulfitobacter sp. TaxID=1903071 RepID=UPI00300201FE
MDARALEAAVETALGAPVPKRLGVAVSGGGDSLALLYLLNDIYTGAGGVLQAITVDHGLRAGSGAEAEMVADQCAKLGISHQILRWQGWDKTGNLQDEARRARYGLMADWARAEGLDAIALGHTADDQAETVLMRLARRSGVDGLAAMSPKRKANELIWLRPMLNLKRNDLRNYLAGSGITWIEDPSNEDTRFDRIKARYALDALADLGIDASSLSVVAQNMNDAREALEVFAQNAAHDCMRVSHGSVIFDRIALLAFPSEVQRRLWCHALDWINPAPYPPRRAALAQLLGAVEAEQATTLGGCAIKCRKGEAWLFREFNQVSNHTVPSQQVWDGRWRCFCANPSEVIDGAELRALGANGLKQCDNWRDYDLPRGVLLSHPALWHGDTVLSSPTAKPNDNWRWKLVRDEKPFFDSAL